MAPTCGELVPRNSPFTTQQITIIAGVTGEIEGVILYGMSGSTVMKIAGTMIGSEVDELDEMAISAVSEIANMVTGNAITILSQKGYNLDITPPSTVMGVDVQISTRAPAMTIPVKTNMGDIEINVSLAQNIMRKAA